MVNKKSRKKSQKKSKKKSRKKRHIYTKKQYNSGDGMLTSTWGPPMWHYLHTMSFNYPARPSQKDKKNYKNFISMLQYVLPCRHCRINLKNNFKAHPLKRCHLKNRKTFSKYIYQLHEIVNKMLGKKSGLSYCEVRERHEHFRARCTEEKPKLFNFRKTRKKEKGCTEPLYGKKSKCIIQIVPQNKRCKSFQMDKKCIKTK